MHKLVKNNNQKFGMAQEDDIETPSAVIQQCHCKVQYYHVSSIVSNHRLKYIFSSLFLRDRVNCP